MSITDENQGLQQKKSQDGFKLNLPKIDNGMTSQPQLLASQMITRTSPFN